MNAPSLSTVHGDWPLALADIKLQLRSKLPGASAFDDAAQGLHAARAAGVPASTLLAPAMAGSWLVNSAVPSPLMQKWLAPSIRKQWELLIEALEGGELDAAQRAAIEGALSAITAVGAAGSIGAISKVLSLVSTAAVPLMPDAALAHVLRALPMPSEADAQTAPARHFLPMLDRVRESTVRSLEAVTELAASSPLRLRPEDVIDRLVWFDSIGYRHFRNEKGGWYWVRSESVEAVVFVAGPPPEVIRPGCVEVPADDDFSTRAHEALLQALAR